MTYEQLEKARRLKYEIDFLRRTTTLIEEPGTYTGQTMELIADFINPAQYNARKAQRIEQLEAELAAL